MKSRCGFVGQQADTKNESTERKEERLYLVVNPGSSSMKMSLFRELDELVSFHYESLAGGATEKMHCTMKWYDGRESSEFECNSMGITFDITRGILAAEHLVDDGHPLRAILIRTVATGDYFSYDREYTPSYEMKSQLDKVGEINVLHIPSTREAAENARKSFPKVKIWLMSDSEALMDYRSRKDLAYSLPKDVRESFGDIALKRYGAHGNSHGYIMAKMRELELPEADGKVIVCHLGSGCSVTAFEKGEPIRHSMGFTPLEGLMSSTRCGSIDPTIPAILGEKLGAEETIRRLNRESGLKARAHTSDMRILLVGVNDGNKVQVDTFNDFVQGVVDCIGAYALCMRGVDAIVFTATMGERSPEVRNTISQYLAILGFFIDKTANEGLKLGSDQEYANIAFANSKPLYVIPTNEALYMVMRAQKKLK